jgi:hypothetical protein
LDLYYLVRLAYLLIDRTETAQGHDAWRHKWLLAVCSAIKQSSLAMLQEIPRIVENGVRCVFEISHMHCISYFIDQEMQIIEIYMTLNQRDNTFLYSPIYIAKIIRFGDLVCLRFEHICHCLQSIPQLGGSGSVFIASGCY